jgi:hypothetical protein
MAGWPGAQAAWIAGRDWERGRRTDLAPARIADDAIGLYLEYLALDPGDPDTARARAVSEVVEGAAVDVAAIAAEMAAEAPACAILPPLGPDDLPR